jgi:mannose-6-phosphate isomerase-like protein (cupin superfamily)
MKAIVTGLSLAVGFAVAMPAFAQQPAAQTPKTFTSAADITALIAKAKSDRKGDAPIVQENILRLAPYNATLEYRGAVGPSAVHEKEAEFFYVIDGTATMITGGKLTEEKRNGDNLTGVGIEGGTPRSIGKGDFIVVPENTAHWFSKIDGTLVLMSLHVPRPVPIAK